MTDEDDEFERVQREIEMRQANCQHRWEPDIKDGAPIYRCARCGLWNFVS